MFQFIHGYIKEQFRGLLKHNMFDETSGIKFHQTVYVPDELRFNTLAAKDGELYQIIREHRRPFYLDRLQGGWIYVRYNFDRQLIKEYEQLLGENFLGFQMHEWASNMANDWERISASPKKESGRYTVEEIEARTWSLTHNGDKMIFLESAVAEEYAAMTFPKTEEEELLQYDWLYENRMETMNNLLLPCDSYYMYPRKELSAGTKALMPEIGAQIPHERMQLALTRGMARAYNRRWGTYYEPWGGDKCSCSYYKKDFVNEWGIRVHESVSWPGCTFTPNSGSSRELQKRIYYHSLFSGADFLSEEHGTANTFYDWNDYELSPYGAVKKEFLSFAAEHRSLGDVFVPAVIVLPKEFEIFDLGYITSGKHYLKRPVRTSLAALFDNMRQVLIGIFGDGKKKYGNEGHCICNSQFGDLFDIVYDDIPVSAFDGYQLILDLSGRIGGIPGKIVLDGQKENVLVELEQLLPSLLPGHMKVTGEVSWILDRYENGYMLAIFNNEGILRTREKGTEVLSGRAARVCIELDGGQLTPVKGLAPVCDNGAYYVVVEPGDVVIYQIK